MESRGFACKVDVFRVVPRMCMEKVKAIKRLPPDFFNRDPRRVSRDLLGKVLMRRHGRELLAGRSVEVEAYLGTGDPAAHAAAGRTVRNDVLFGPPGHPYVYFISRPHSCLPLSRPPHGVPARVLLRALEPVGGLEKMAHARGVSLHR